MVAASVLDSHAHQQRAALNELACAPIRDAEHVHSAYLHPLAGRGYALELGKGGVCISGEISLAGVRGDARDPFTAVVDGYGSPPLLVTSWLKCPRTPPFLPGIHRAQRSGCPAKCDKNSAGPASGLLAAAWQRHRAVADDTFRSSLGVPTLLICAFSGLSGTRQQEGRII